MTQSKINYEFSRKIYIITFGEAFLLRQIHNVILLTHSNFIVQQVCRTIFYVAIEKVWCLWYNLLDTF